ncbi:MULTISPECIES: hypothetical protein [Photorhabdus]|nr:MULTISPECIES: hypothetical protein [Photorhabdus]
MTGVRECSQQRGNLKDDGYKLPLTNGLAITREIKLIFILKE